MQFPTKYDVPLCCKLVVFEERTLDYPGYHRTLMVHMILTGSGELQVAFGPRDGPAQV